MAQSFGRHLTRTGLAKMIDHTLLGPTASASDVSRLCDEALAHGFWSVCVGPSHVKLAAQRLKDADVKVCTVVGFPLGYNKTEVKLMEARMAIEEGADEIDMVMNLGAFKSGDYDPVVREVEKTAILCMSNQKVLKVIIECCYLNNEEKVRAARIAERSGAAFVKTSTGFGPSGATVEDVALLKRSLSGGAMVKAAGGISSLERALEMVKAGADRIGTSSGVRIMEEWPRGLPGVGYVV